MRRPQLQLRRAFPESAQEDRLGRKLNWLEQAGLDLAKGLKFVLNETGTTAVNVVTGPATVIGDISKMVGVVKDVEALDATLKGTGLTSEQKLAGAAVNVQQIVLDSEFLFGKKIADQALFNKAIGEYTQATVDLAQSLEAQPAQSSGAAAPTVTSSTATPAAAPVPVPAGASEIPED